MKYSRLIIVALIGILCLLMTNCSALQPGISRENAIKIAEERVEADNVMSLAGRTPVVVDEEGRWHVYFLLPPEELGGEPHVLIDKKKGTIIEVYYTE